MALHNKLDSRQLTKQKLATYDFDIIDHKSEVVKSIAKHLGIAINLRTSYYYLILKDNELYGLVFLVDFLFGNGKATLFPVKIKSKRIYKLLAAHKQKVQREYQLDIDTYTQLLLQKIKGI